MKVLAAAAPAVVVPLVVFRIHVFLFHANAPVPLETPDVIGLCALGIAVFACTLFPLDRASWLRRPALLAYSGLVLLLTTGKLMSEMLSEERFQGVEFWVFMALTQFGGLCAALLARKWAGDLNAAEARMRRMAYGATDGLWEFEFASGRVHWSESFGRIFGYDIHTTLPTREWWLITMHPEDFDRVFSSFQAACENPAVEYWTEVFRFKRADGVYVWVLDRCRFDRDKSGRCLTAFGGMIDISERVGYELKLQELTAELEDRVTELARANDDLVQAQARVRRMARAGSDGLWILDMEEQSISWDATFGNTFGYKPERITPTFEWWMSRVHPDEVAGVTASFDKAAANPEAESWSYVYRFARADGVYVWVLDRCVFERREGACIRAFGGLLDISDRISIEEDLRRRVEERTRDLAELTFSVTHDLKSPLGAILGYGELLSSVLTSVDPRARAYLANILKGADRMRVCIDDMLDQARLDAEEAAAAPVDLLRLLEDIRAELAFKFEEKGGRLVLPESCPGPVVTVRNLLYRVLQNLVGNAVKYAKPDVPPEVRISVAINTGRLVITVADNGVGIPQKDTPDMFKMGVRTNTAFASGHGIGLHSVRRAITRLGGTVRVDSAVGVGTTFHVEIPVPAPQPV